MQHSNIAISKGKIILYRVFDVGNEINLEKAGRILEQNLSTERFKLKKESLAIIINNAPLTLHLPSWQYTFENYQFEVNVIGKIWYFGAISIALHVNLPSEIPLTELVGVSHQIETDPKFTEYAQTKVKEITGQMTSCIENLNIWQTYEDYSIYFIEAFSNPYVNILDVLNWPEIYSMLLADPTEKLSEQIKKSIADKYIQYANNDLTLIEWNSALVIEPSGITDTAEVIEFALCQLLEMRYYDDLLDSKLNTLYSAIISKKSSILSNRYSRTSQDAATTYLELSEIVENIENALKIIGDFYLARTFRAASTRFRIKDWQASVDNKLNNLAEVSKLLHNEVSEKRSTLLEFIIIILIGVEVVPFLFKLFLKQ